MNVAICHDYLNQYGGAERVLEVFLDMFPDADLYTLLHDGNSTNNIFSGNLRKTSFLDSPLMSRSHRLFIPLMPIAADKLRLDKDYDLVLTSSAGYAKGFHRGGANSPHICYCHTPLRYGWEDKYLQKHPWPRWITEVFSKTLAPALRRWDKRASENVSLFIANSEYIGEKIESYYKRDSYVVYPPVDSDVFYPDYQKEADDYFLMVGRFMYYKLFTLGVRAFNEMDKKLVIVGSGPQEEHLKEMAGKNIEFRSGVSDDELRRLYSGARALIFPQVEDFGLVAAEAQMCGAPVISYNKGGGAEIVEGGKTGILFDQQNVQSIKDAVSYCERCEFDRDYIAKRAKKFSKNRFKKEIKSIIKSAGLPI